MLILRRIIFYIFALLYIILCPLLILYSFGYILNPAKENFTQTALIYFSTMPEGANVYLGKSRYIKKTPTAIPELLPGTYYVSLTLKDYKIWSDSIKLEPGKAVTLENILLIPNRWKSEKLSSDFYKGIVPLDGINLLLLVKGKKLGDYFIYDSDKEKISPLLQEESQFRDFPVEAFYKKKNSAMVVVYSGWSGDRRYLLLDISAKNTKVKEITRLFPARPLYIDWDIGNGKTIFAFYKNYIDRLDLKPENLYFKYERNIIGFGLHKERIYYIDNQSNIFQFSYDQQKNKKLFLDTELSKQLFNTNSRYRIEFLKDNIILFMSGNGQLLTNRPPYQITKKGLVDTQFQESRNLLLYWTRHKIGIADFFSEDNGRVLFDYAVSTRIIYDKGKDIEQCFWAGDKTHIVIKDGNRVYIIELEPQGAPHVYQVAEVMKNTKIYYSGETGYLYYLDNEKGVLKGIAVIPRMRFVIKNALIDDKEKEK